MITTNGTHAAILDAEMRLTTIREALAIRARLLARIAELEAAERETEMQLIVIRNLLADERRLLTPPAPQATIFEA